MPKFTYLDRINYGPHKGGYDYNGRCWTGHFYRLVKDTELGVWDLTITDPETDEVVGTRRQSTVSEADLYIGSLIGPLRRAEREAQQAEQARLAEERKAKAAAAKAARLATDSHNDSDVIIKAKITRQEAIKLAERLLHWAMDSNNKNEPMDSRCIEFNITYTDGTRREGWRHPADDARMAVGIGWTSSDDVFPVIEDSLIAKRAKPEPVSVDDDLAAAV